MEIIAHRGNKRYAPENTMAAFKAAQKYPIAGIEFDVQFSNDGVPVVIHDEKLDRTTTGSGLVSSYSYEELLQFDAGVWFHERFKGERIPSLEQVLQWGRDKAIILHVELKSQRIHDNAKLDCCLDLFEKYNMVDSIVISTFQHSYITYLKNQNPKLKTALLTKYPFFRADVYAEKIKADAIHIRHSFHASRFYQKWKERGLKVRPYNVQRMKDALKCHFHRVDAVITNDLKMLIEFNDKLDKK